MTTNDEEDLKIRSLRSYIETIDRLRMDYLYNISNNINEDQKEEEYQEALKTGTPQKMYFRGHANSTWPISPNAFRKNILSCESEMIQRAYLNNPEILEGKRTPFERLSVLQHYELGTRLLDITGNPLVALYFACQPYKNETAINNQSDFFTELDDEIFTMEIKEKLLKQIESCKLYSSQETDGVVFIKCAYAVNFNKKEVQILSHLAEQNISRNYTVTDLLESLEDKKILIPREIDIFKKNNYKLLIDVLQNSFCVESNRSNERLSRQNGAFLISGHINIKKLDNGDIQLEKATGDLNEEFKKKRIIIAADCKEVILKELDNYNTNESSLFPELDHQLKYIQSKCKENLSLIPKFEPQKSKSNKENDESSSLPHDEEKEVIIVEISDEKLEEIINTSINKFVQKEVIANEIKKIIQENMLVDWYKKESVLSNIQSDIKKCLFSKPEFNAINSKSIASKIVENIRSSINNI